MASPTKKSFKPSASAENNFAKALRKVAKYSGHIVEAHVDGAKLHDEEKMNAALNAYAKLIGPWAERQSKKMLAQVQKSNLTDYNRQAKVRMSKANSKKMGKLLKENVAEKDVGATANALMNEQVELIQSLPLRAGLRAQKLAQEAFFNGTRASEIADELARSSKVSESQAMCIARTEVARSNASFTQARAQAVGSQSYIWRTSMDGAERDSHAKMNGKTVLYSQEPTLSDGTTGHAGTFPNCRCYQDVQFDDDNI